MLDHNVASMLDHNVASMLDHNVASMFIKLTHCEPRL